MPTLEPAAIAHLDSGDPSKPIFLAYLDVDGDPLRATSTGYAIQLPVLDDADLSGQTFLPTSGILTVGPVEHKEGGSDTLTIDISGLLLPDQDILAAIGDRSKWQGRAARLWVIIRNEDRIQQGAIAQYYQGWMSSVRIIPRPGSQIIRLEVEGYKALLSQPSNRTYQDQARYDPADTSATATIGAANGSRTGPAALVGVGGGSGGPGREAPRGISWEREL